MIRTQFILQGGIYYVNLVKAIMAQIDAVKLFASPDAKCDVNSDPLFTSIKSTDVSFSDVVGLADVKEAVFDKIINPRKHPELYKKFNIKTGGGILMYGPPGTGKTMIAKAIAKEIGADFYSIKCSDHISKWFGETERNIRELFDKARESKTSIIFFDEIDALAVNRDGCSSSPMQRVVPELLAQIQGINEQKKGHSMLLIAATNKLWLIDSGFLRPGRFDDKIYVGLPDTDARAELVREVKCCEKKQWQSVLHLLLSLY